MTALQDAELEKATDEKLRLEEKQREVRKERKVRNCAHQKVAAELSSKCPEFRSWYRLLQTKPARLWVNKSEKGMAVSRHDVAGDWPAIFPVLVQATRVHTSAETRSRPLAGKPASEAAQRATAMLVGVHWGVLGLQGQERLEQMSRNL